MKKGWRRRLWGVFALALAIALLAAGCHAPVGKGPQGNEGSYTVTDAAGTAVKVPHKPHRILTLSMSTDEIVLGLVPPSDMAACNSLLDDPVSSNVTNLSAQIEKKITYPSAEEIAALNPDLVIIPDWGDLSRVDALRDLGIPVVVCEAGRDLPSIESSIRRIAAAVGESQRGETLIAQMQDKLDEIQAKVETIPPWERKSVVLISLMKTYGGKNSSFDAACQLAGVTNGRAAAGIEDGQTMSKEQLVEIDPDFLFLPTYRNQGKYDVDAFRKEYVGDPALQTMKAIQNGALREPFEGYIYNCSQDFVFGVQEIDYAVYGDAFAQPHDEHLTAVGK